MLLDFTPHSIQNFFTTLLECGYTFYPFADSLTQPQKKSLILRHDVDLRPEFALEMAELEASLGIRGTYYFRIVPASLDPDVIERIAELGHEVGYHYEDLALVGSRKYVVGKEERVGGWKHKRQVSSRKYGVGRKRMGDNDKGQFEQQQSVVLKLKELDELLERGIERFEKNLKILRQHADIKTICMHGSPLSRWDSRLLWTKYDYRDFGLIGEPYFDVNFNEVLYLTDTGRRWDGDAVSVRDKPLEAVEEFVVPVQTDPHKPRLSEHYRFRSTFELIRAAEQGRLPDRMMLTIHPQRWTSRPLPWVRELVWQNVKNVIKWGVVRSSRK